MEFAPCKGIRIPESGKFSHVESRILGLGFRNTAVGIRNPSSAKKYLEYGYWNPESKTVLDSLTWGDGMYCSLLSFFSVYTPLTDHGHEANSSEKLINVTNLLHNGLLHF